MIVKIKHKKEIYDCLIDDEDFDLVNDYKWYIHSRTGYARGRKKNPQKKNNFISMHRLVMRVLDKPEVEIDHTKHNKLDNRKSELRICNRSGNTSNRTSYGSSQYLGVGWDKQHQMWKASIGYTLDGIKKFKNIGIFKEEENAAKAYDEAAKKYHKEFANLNFK
jgi:hypothetical protein